MSSSQSRSAPSARRLLLLARCVMVVVVSTGGKCMVGPAERLPRHTSHLRLTGIVRDATGAPWSASTVDVLARLRNPPDCGSPLVDDGWVALRKSSGGTFSDTLAAYDDAPRAPQCLQVRVNESNLGPTILDTLIANAATGPLNDLPLAHADLRLNREQP